MCDHESGDFVAAPAQSRPPRGSFLPIEPDQGRLGAAAPRCAGKLRGRHVMPAETAMVVSGVVIAFVIFMLALAWADFRTRPHTS